MVRSSDTCAPLTLQRNHQICLQQQKQRLSNPQEWCEHRRHCRVVSPLGVSKHHLGRIEENSTTFGTSSNCCAIPSFRHRRTTHSRPYDLPSQHTTDFKAQRAIVLNFDLHLRSSPCMYFFWPFVSHPLSFGCPLFVSSVLSLILRSTFSFIPSFSFLYLWSTSAILSYALGTNIKFFLSY